MLPDTVARTHEKQVASWLLLCCALVFAMVVLGGVTRLTGSGLSMVEWKPLMGVLPPLSETEWQATFERYQQFPEYRERNFGMSLAQFKMIFAFEYAHRMLGRAIGVVFLVPFLYFLARRRLDRATMPKLAVLFGLGALQGLLGWFMVMSGLVDEPHVSQYRLTAHLMLAVLIFGYMLWVALDLADRAPVPGAAPKRIRRLVTAALALALVTMASGGFVAGLKAGFAYNTFPLMGGRLIPEGLFATSPWWLAPFEDITTVQFDHRVLALTTFGVVLATWIIGLRGALPGALRPRLHLMLAAAAGQVALGIGTLLMQVPVALGAAHQGGALVLLTALIWLRHGIARTAPESAPAARTAAASRGGIPA